MDHRQEPGENESPITVGLAGLGIYGEKHLPHLLALSEAGAIRLTDVVDPVMAMSRESAAILEKTGARRHRDWEQFLARGNSPASIILALPVDLHEEYIARAYACGMHVYVEKPAVPLTQQLRRLIGMESAGGAARTMVGFQFSNSVQFRSLEDWIRQGRIGRLKSLRLVGARPRSDAQYRTRSWTGKMWDKGRPVFDGPATSALAHGVHDLFYLASLFPEMMGLPKEVIAEFYRAAEIDSYDICTFRGAFEAGGEFSVALAHAIDEEIAVTFEIIGEKGSLVIGGKGRELIDPATGERVASPEPTPLTSLKTFFSQVREGIPPRPGLADVLPYTLATNAALASSRGIHPVAPAFLSRTPLGDDWLVHVPSLKTLLLQASHEGRNLSEISVPWAVPGSPETVRLARTASA